MPKDIAAHILLKRFDGDDEKAKKTKRKLMNKGMIRRDEKGKKIVDSKIKRDKGPPPKKARKK